MILFGAQPARAAITVSITQPTAGAVVGDSLTVSANITSVYQLASVTAQVGPVVSPLPATASTSGTLDISSVATGSSTVTVTATDTLGNSGSGQVTFAHDYPPTVTVTDPLPGTVARATLHVAAACTDTDAYGCASLAVHVGSPTGTVLASVNAATIDQTLSLGAYLNQKISLYLVATDSAGLTAASAALPIYVDTSPRLVEIQSVPGPIVDVDSTRILYGMTIRTRGTTTDVALPGTLGDDCRLSPNGALCNGGEWKSGAQVASWTKALTGTGNGNPYFAARGNYAIWVSMTGTGPSTSIKGYYRDSNAGTTTQVIDNGGSSVYANDVAANGEAVFLVQNAVTDYDVERYSGGTLTALTTLQKFTDALTDGTNIISQHYFTGFLGAIDLFTGGSTILLGSDSTCFSLNAYNSYAVANGFTAYGVPDSACGSVQVWLRAPDDTRTQLSVWSTNSRVETVNDDGQVMMLNSSALGSYRYLASPGMLPDTISSQLGRAIWLDNQWYIVMGRTLFSIGPAPLDGGAGPMDAGPTDAGTSPTDAGTSPTDAGPAPADGSAPRYDASVGPADAAAPSESDAAAPSQQDAALPDTHASGNGGCDIAFGAASAPAFFLVVLLVWVLALRRRAAPGSGRHR